MSADIHRILLVKHQTRPVFCFIFASSRHIAPFAPLLQLDDDCSELASDRSWQFSCCAHGATLGPLLERSPHLSESNSSRTVSVTSSSSRTALVITTTSTVDRRGILVGQDSSRDGRPLRRQAPRDSHVTGQPLDLK
jgi:hypothetical protein